MVRYIARVSASIVGGIALVTGVAGHAQTFATHDEPQGVAPIAIGERVERSYLPVTEQGPAPMPEQAYSVPVYDSYEPTAFDDSGYRAARETASPALVPVYQAPVYDPVTYPAAIPTPAQPLDFAPPLQYLPTAPVESVAEPSARPYGQPVDVTPRGPVLTPPPASVSAGLGDIGFKSETETSRQLLALDDAHAARLSAMEQAHLQRRRALLDSFAQEADDPAKVIGLADRMRAGVDALDAAHRAMIAEEEANHRRATLRILDASPSRIQ